MKGKDGSINLHLSTKCIEYLTWKWFLFDKSFITVKKTDLTHKD
jgi:hypothetical protein